MLTLLGKLLIPDGAPLPDAERRRRWGALCGGMGVLLNLLLVAAKLAISVRSASIAVTADALNNLSDALSSLMTLLGFRLAARRPDRHHPFGHRRYEYIAALLVSLAILLMGLELGHSCVNRILHPQPVHFALLPACILAASVLVKLYMARYNRSIGRRMQSPTLLAASTDSLCDALATAVTLAATALSAATGRNIDAWAGAAVSLLILWAGIRSLRDTLDPLLGRAPDPAFVQRVEEIVAACPEVLGMHDLMVHDYGVGRTIITLHAEVRADAELCSLHEGIDRLERRLGEELGCSATIHIDPVSKDAVGENLRQRLEADIHAELDPGVTLHDFHYEPGTLLRFDAALPYELRCSDEEAHATLCRLAAARCPGALLEIDVDRK